MQEINTVITFTGLTANNARKKTVYYRYIGKDEQYKGENTVYYRYIGKDGQYKKEILFITVTLVKTNNT